jgi:hypothetical protein
VTPAPGALPPEPRFWPPTLPEQAASAIDPQTAEAASAIRLIVDASVMGMLVAIPWERVEHPAVDQLRQPELADFLRFFAKLRARQFRKLITISSVSSFGLSRCMTYGSSRADFAIFPTSSR